MYIIIVGLGKLGSTLTKQLSTEGHDIVVVDPDNSVVSSTVDAYDVMGICGNGATYEVLKEAGAAKAKLIIAATGSDELNLLCCMFAKKAGHCTPSPACATRCTATSWSSSSSSWAFPPSSTPS